MAPTPPTGSSTRVAVNTPTVASEATSADVIEAASTPASHPPRCRREEVVDIAKERMGSPAEAAG